MTNHHKAIEVVNVEQDTIDRLILLAADLLLAREKNAKDLEMAIMCRLPLSRKIPLAAQEHILIEIFMRCKCHLGIILHAQYCWMGQYGAWEEMNMVK
jgi:hypothetical protein